MGQLMLFPILALLIDQKALNLIGCGLCGCGVLMFCGSCVNTDNNPPYFYTAQAFISANFAIAFSQCLFMTLKKCTSES